MTQEEKNLLLKDLCGRLPYGVRCRTYLGDDFTLKELNRFPWGGYGVNGGAFAVSEVRPYLRPLQSMTEDEARFILGKIVGDRKILSVDIGRDEITANVDDGVSSYEKVWVFYNEIVHSLDLLDYLNIHHFDYRGLIPIGLALEAPEGMYNI